jgi:hypothetical protein
MSETWNETIIIPLHKKGDKTECSNYKGISLLNSVYKVFFQNSIKPSNTLCKRMLRRVLKWFL